ncbi:PEPxxWA-CTERM sorting domain-containing protein [Sandaracinobacteroides saxicola]|uniref:PEP-CTERM sorting domain-containing protein n=1 Tax=Sandaracinobacteroides saxicola TaxID=2759707 RepID=A0A7G5IKH1_9SPHN|nr:PEPxxWA-CTERM sorting domain-containing protein [Sandaracinobacteroides saxicola]QMW23863.1 PEP-CTERM sorting domain-containing protein [Sandaracinobacteroides saxicola]
MMRYDFLLVVAAAAAAAVPAQAANQLLFSSGGPDGRMASASGPAPGDARETETADDFVLGRASRIAGGQFTGLVPLGGASVQQVEIEFYRVFPGDSANPPSGRVPTRENSPADEDFAARDSAAGELSYRGALGNAPFTVANSVVTGINPLPGVFTGGEGAVTGQLLTVDFSFADPLLLEAGHYFFRPEVRLSDGTFLWLSAAKPIVAPGTPFVPDLQSWIRDSGLSPDWLRIGTDITREAPFNASFSLTGSAVPEPASWAMMIIGFGLVGAALRRKAAIA